MPSSYGLTNLKELNLSENSRLGGRIPSDWGDFGRLENLVLSHTHLSATIPESIGNMTSLRHLISGFTAMSGSIPTTVGYYTDLGKRLQEKLYDPKQRRPLTSLPESVHLWLKNSIIDGSIPSELGSCTQLEFLSLTNNFLTGSLATELGNLSRLKTVSVSGNKYISGTLPVEYANLVFMEDFDSFKTQIMDPPQADYVAVSTGANYPYQHKMFLLLQTRTMVILSVKLNHI